MHYTVYFFAIYKLNSSVLYEILSSDIWTRGAQLIDSLFSRYYKNKKKRSVLYALLSSDT